MDAHLFRLFVKAATPTLLDSRIEKIQEPDDALLTLNLYGHNTKRQLVWSYKRGLDFCFLSQGRLSSQKSPSAQIMRLRKYFANRKIISIVPQVWQRKLWLLAGNGNASANASLPWLCLDLHKGPSLHFLNVEESPQEDEANWPENDNLPEACANWRAFPVLTPLLRKSLAQMDKLDGLALLEDLKSASGNLFLYLTGKNNTEQIIRISAWPLEQKAEEFCLELSGEDYLKGLERAGNDLILRKQHEIAQEHLLAPVRKRLARLHRILEKLDKDEKRLLAMTAKEKDGQAIHDNLWLFDSSSHYEEIEIEAGGNKRKIYLNPKNSLLENMEHFFKEAKRGKRGLQMLQERKSSLLAEIAALEQPDSAESIALSAEQPSGENGSERKPKLSRLAALRATLPKNVQAHISADGHIFLRGKDAAGNRRALRLAQGYDLWAHVETGQGAHVIIRRKFPGEEISEETMGEAASLVAVKSWHKEAGSCKVMFAEVRHVKPARNGPPGKVLIDKLFRSAMFPIDQQIEEKLAKNDN